MVSYLCQGGFVSITICLSLTGLHKYKWLEFSKTKSEHGSWPNLDPVKSWEWLGSPSG